MTDAKAKMATNPDLMKEFRELNGASDGCCQLTLRQPLPDKQLVRMTDASFEAPGFAVRIEDNQTRSTRNHAKLMLL